MVQKHSQLALISGGLAKIFQDPDLSTNKSFKNKLSEKLKNWMFSSIYMVTKTKRMRCANYEDVSN